MAGNAERANLQHAARLAKTRHGAFAWPEVVDVLGNFGLILSFTNSFWAGTQ